MILHCLKVSIRLYISSSVSSRFRLSCGGHGVDMELCDGVFTTTGLPTFYLVDLFKSLILKIR